MRLDRRFSVITCLISAIWAISCGLGTEHSAHLGADLTGLPTAERFEAIVAIPDPLQRSAQWIDFLGDLHPSDAKEVGDRFDKSVGRVDEAAAILFGSWWTGVDPLAALKSASGWPWDGGRLGIRVVLRRWAANDPKAAFAILGEMPLEDETVLQNATRALATGFFEGDRVPSKADLDHVLTVIKPIADPKSRIVAFDALILGMSSYWGLDAAQDFVDTLHAGPHANIERDFSHRFVSQFASMDPERAAAWVEETAPGDAGKHLRRRLGARWARFDGSSAMTWASQQPAGSGRDAVVEHTYRNFVNSSEEAAVEWMRERKGDVALRAALPMFLSYFARSQPEQAADWLTLVEDPSGRRVAAMNVARGWLQLDEPAARDWLPGSGLSPRDRAKLVRELKTPR